MKLNKLTPEEERIIRDKGTEAPFSGEYEKFSAPGAFACRRCESPLYLSYDKFDSGCGWPSFDREIPGAIRWTLDADGRRTEITCERCGAHLGHVFLGEKLTPRDTRHCVNSLSLKFVPEEKTKDREENIYLGGGCFWCIEAFFQRLKGVKQAVSGYAGGDLPDPTYDQVCGGATNHAEVVKVIFDPFRISLEKILEVFFFVHDPTTLNQQGNDKGAQYRSIILFEDENQKEIVENFVKRLDEKKEFEKKIITEMKKLDKFYPAEKYHHNYYEENKEAPYCQLVISPKMAKFSQKFQTILEDQ